MNIENLMSGIAVVIDDAFGENSSDGDQDRIVQLVNDIEANWKIPFYKTHEIPSHKKIRENLLKSASFILLDWHLSKNGGATLEDADIKKNIQFLEQAKDYFVPVFIFTNANPSDVSAALPDSLYNKDRPERNFIFIKQKENLIEGALFDSIKDWIQKSASVYTLKVWEQAFYEAKKSLFSSMYAKSPDWPKVFWKSYKDDHVEPSSSMAHLINNILIGRMELDIFKEEIAPLEISDCLKQDIQSVWEEASFIQKGNLPANSVKSGDLFIEKSESDEKYFLNIRADCDCIPRNRTKIDSVELYCIEGKTMTPEQVEELFMTEYGTFNEQENQAIVFGIHDGKTIRFKFRKLVLRKFSEIKNNRIGRIIHPYITRIQQRYALYLQRQGLPRIPQEAIQADSEPN